MPVVGSPRPIAHPWAAAIAAVAALCTTAPAAPALASDVETQAAFISMLGRFVTWPDAAFETNGAPVVVGLLGSGPLADAVQSTLPRKSLRDRPYDIRVLSDVSEAADCHIVVVTETRESAARDIAHQLKDLGALSVGQSSAFAEAGGVVGMVMHDGRVAFDVNQQVARRADLKIDGRLLRLATHIY
jgi:hypothetical protein